MYLLAIALAPVAFIFTYVYLRDKYDREPLRILIITFILGVGTAYPALKISQFLHDLTGVSIGSSSFLGVFIYAFFVVAFTEEMVKFLVLRIFNYPRKEFNEPYDGIMYGVAVSLGFAAIENVIYVHTAGADGLQTGIARMFTAVPAHAVFGVMMGYFVGRAKFLPLKYRWLERLKGLLVAILFHGLYDLFLFLPESQVLPSGEAWGAIALLAFVTLFVGIRLSRKAIQLHTDDSPFKYNSTYEANEEEPEENNFI